MKVLIEIPSWLGDSVMSTPAIENLMNYYNSAQVILVGSKESIQLFFGHPRVEKTFVLMKEYRLLYILAKKLGHFDIFITFRGSLRSKFFKLIISSNRKFQFRHELYPNRHQVKKYNDFINDSLSTNFVLGALKIYHKPLLVNKNTKPLVGINPGASYGDAKRWYPEAFAKVIRKLHSQYDVIIFGGPREKNIASDIEKFLINYGISNYENLAGKTSISQLIDRISTLDLFITGDSGPMHIAASFQVPTVSIFGPTNDKETSQWMNANSTIIKKNLQCQPCMKRTCPLKHHHCMSLIQSEDVLKSISSIS
jgi:heptosyltransferase II